jgi:hypothetical protein
MWNELGKKESHEIERRPTEIRGTAGGMARLFGQMMLLPLVTFVYAVESFAKALREIRHTSARTLDTFTGRHDDFDHEMVPRYADGPRSRGEPASCVNETDCAALNVNGRSSQTTVQSTETEDHEMTEQDLRGDDLKVVRWTISFIRRDVEKTLDFGLDMINYSTTEGDYRATKRDEYFRESLGRGKGFKRPQEWVSENYPPALQGGQPNPQYIENRSGIEYVINLPEEDKNKYIRVHIEVVTRYEKQERPYKKVKVIQ